MPDRIKIYKIKDFTRLTETGKLDVDQSLNLVRELAVAANYYKDHHILADLRDTELQAEFDGVLQIVAEFVNFRESFKNKIAILIPNTEERFEKARQVKALMDIQGFQFKQFIEFEDAMEWFSD